MGKTRLEGATKVAPNLSSPHRHTEFERKIESVFLYGWTRNGDKRENVRARHKNRRQRQRECLKLCEKNKTTTDAQGEWKQERNYHHHHHHHNI